MADPSLAAEIEMDSRCGGCSHGVGFLQVMALEVKVTCDDSEAVLSLAPSLET